MNPQLLEALKVLLSEWPEDWVYEVRDRIRTDAGYTGSSWDHPRVKAYAAAIKTIRSMVEAEGKDGATWTDANGRTWTAAG